MCMGCKKQLWILGIATVLVISVFLFLHINIQTIDYVMPLRIKKVLAIILTAIAIAVSSTIFQTITNNRILTPSIIGLDSLYLFIQTLIVFLFGALHITMLHKEVNFFLSVGVMVLFSNVIFTLLFRKEGRNIFIILLIGMVFGTLFQSFSTFMQLLINPDEFLIIQDKMFASFQNIDVDILLV